MTLVFAFIKYFAIKKEVMQLNTASVTLHTVNVVALKTRNNSPSKCGFEVTSFTYVVA